MKILTLLQFIHWKLTKGRKPTVDPVPRARYGTREHSDARLRDMYPHPDMLQRTDRWWMDD